MGGRRSLSSLSPLSDELSQRRIQSIIGTDLLIVDVSLAALPANILHKCVHLLQIAHAEIAGLNFNTSPVFHGLEPGGVFKRKIYFCRVQNVEKRDVVLALLEFQ